MLRSLLNLDIRTNSSKGGRYYSIEKLLSTESKALVTSLNKKWKLSECSQICGLINAVFEEYKADKLVLEVLLESYSFMREKMKDSRWALKDDVCFCFIKEGTIDSVIIKYDVCAFGNSAQEI